jgi:hypothetical protein
MAVLLQYYFSIGGKIDELEVTAYLHALMPLLALDQELPAHAVTASSVLG